MKNTQNSKETAKSQTGNGISELPGPLYQTQLTRQTKHKLPNIFLIQNKGKGPPGRQRSPGAVICRNPEHPPDEQTRLRFLDSKKSGYLSVLKRLNSEDLPTQVRIRSKAELHVDFQPSFKNYKRTQITNFYHNLIFTIMKKQILILTFFVLAIFAGTKSYAQNTSAKPGSAPRTLTGCADDALHPIAGKPYTYKLTGTPAGGTYTWWATTSPDFITTTGTTTTNNLSTRLGSPTTTPVGTQLTATSANYGTTGASDEVTITWGSTILSTTTYNTAPTFVVGYYEAIAPNCADNLKVYQLDPKNGFIVDIRNVDGTTIKNYGETVAQCFDDVRSAKFVTNQVEYNFGTNILAYEVVAANFSEEWTPTFTVTGLNAVQVPTIQWSYDAPSTWSATTVWHAATDKVVTTETNTSTGVSIYVRVTIANNNYEGIGDEAVTLAVAGTNKDGDIDVNNADCTEPATLAAAAADDTAVQTLTKRPTLTPGTTGSPAPNTTIVPGNNVN